MLRLGPCRRGDHRSNLSPLLSIVVLLTTPLSSRSAFLSQPSLKWTYRLDGTGKVGSPAAFRKGNAVVTSRDGGYLYATTDDGALHILQLKDGEGHRTEGSDPRILSDETGAGGVNGDATVRFRPRDVEGRYTECQSGISLHETVFGVKYAVYAVIDVPIVKNKAPVHDSATGDTSFGSGDSEDLSSRVIAVNPDGTLRWEVALEGYISGTPIIGHDGDKIFVSQNIPGQPSHPIYEPDFYRGKIKIIRDNNAGMGEGGVEIAASKYLESRTAPYGPLTVRTVHIGDTPRDVVVFAESGGDGHLQSGQVYMITPSHEYDARNGRGNGAYNLRILSSWSRSTVASPAISEDGSSVCAGGVGSILASWDLGSFITSAIRDPLEPTWETVVDGSERNNTQPLRGAAVLSADAKSLFVAGASTSFFSLDATSGKIQWKDSKRESVFISEPKYSIDPITKASVVYAIEHLSGKVYQYDAVTGDKKWKWGCRDIEGITTCEDSVEAEFSVSPNGNLLFYGDIRGTIVAIQVAEFTRTPASSGEVEEVKHPVADVPTGTTEAPTALPPGTTEAPTALPILAIDSSASATTSDADDATSSANGKAGLIAGLLTGIAIVLVLLLFVLRRKMKAKATDERVAEEADGGAAQSADAGNEIAEVVPRASNKSITTASATSSSPDDNMLASLSPALSVANRNEAMDDGPASASPGDDLFAALSSILSPGTKNEAVVGSKSTTPVSETRETSPHSLSGGVVTEDDSLPPPPPASPPPASPPPALEWQKVDAYHQSRSRSTPVGAYSHTRSRSIPLPSSLASPHLLGRARTQQSNGADSENFGSVSSFRQKLNVKDESVEVTLDEARSKSFGIKARYI